MAKDIEDMTLKELEEFQAENRKKIKENRERVAERKRRTHRLIVRGAEIERLIPGIEDLTEEQYKELIEALFFK